ncbi:MAG: T9SS type A sorting domain-containing protein [Bacteroidota bacterium]
MKKTLIILSVFALVYTTSVAYAQVINPGFEIWTNDQLVPTAMNPNSGNNTYGWWDYNCFNSSLIGSSPISVVRCTDTVHSGNYSVRLETKVYTPTSWNIYKYWGIPFIGHEYNDTLGILFNGKVDVISQTFIPGIQFTQNLDQFKFYYQYSPNGNDTAECRVSLMSAGAYVAGGVFKTNVATSGLGWQQAVIDFDYVSGLTPDTLFVLISSSSLDYDPKAGSVLWIDDVSVVLSTGIEQVFGEENNLVVFPNPTTGKIIVEAENIERIEVLDMQGKLVKSQKYHPEFAEGTKVKSQKCEIDLSDQVNGIYIIKVSTDKQLITRKLVKQ